MRERDKKLWGIEAVSKRGLKSWSRENSLGDNPLTLKNPVQTSPLNDSVEIKVEQHPF